MSYPLPGMFGGGVWGSTRLTLVENFFSEANWKTFQLEILSNFLRIRVNGVGTQHVPAWATTSVPPPSPEKSSNQRRVGPRRVCILSDNRIYKTYERIDEIRIAGRFVAMLKGGRLFPFKTSRQPQRIPRR